MLNSLLVILFFTQLSWAETSLTKTQIDQIADAKSKVNKVQSDLDELLVRKTQVLNKSELDQILNKIVKAHQELIDSRKNYASLLEDLAKDKPLAVQSIKNQDLVAAELKRGKKDKKMGISGVAEKENLDPLTKKLNDVLSLVQSKYSFFTTQKNEYVDAANAEILIKEMRAKERERKDYLQNRAKQKFVQ